MAIKDWKEERKIKNNIVWFNIKTKNRLYLQSETNIANSRDFMPWSVRSDNEVKDYYFKTKQQALKFAKEYMRKN